MIHLDSFQRFDLDAVHLFGRFEDAVADILQLEIRGGLALVQGVFCRTHFLGIVEPVPGLDAGTRRQEAGRHIGIHHLLHIIDFPFGLFHRRPHDLGQEGIHRHGVLSHLVVQLVGREVRESQHFSLAGTQAQDFQAKGVVVQLASIVAARRIGAEHGLAAVTVGTRSHLRRVRRNGNAELFLEGIVLRQEVVAEFLLGGGELQVDLLHLFLLGCGQTDTAARKALIVLLRVKPS